MTSSLYVGVKRVIKKFNDDPYNGNVVAVAAAHASRSSSNNIVIFLLVYA